MDEPTGHPSPVTEEAPETAAPKLPCGPEEALACILEVARELDTAADLGSGLERVAERLREFVAYDTLGILLLDDQGKDLRFEVAVGYRAEVVEHWRFGIGQGIVGTAAKTGQPVRVDDTRQDPRYINAVDAVRSELAIPLVVKQRTVGVLDLGSHQRAAFTAGHQRLLSLLGSHLAGAIEGARLYQNVREQARTLSVLHEMGCELTAILDRRKLLETVAELAARLIDYDLFGVFLWNEETRLLEPALAVSRDQRAAVLSQSLPLGHGICGTVAALRQPLRVPNVHLEPRYVSCVGNLDVRSELAVPLVSKGRLVGVLALDSVRYDAFTALHEQLFATLGATLAISLENARLYEQLQAQEKALKTDLDTAREIQKQLLPKVSPWIGGLQVAVAYSPARQLGGDFYDFLSYGEGRAAIAVGDVAGKGTAAALYGSLAVGMLREHAARQRAEPARILADMNSKLRDLKVERRFVAMAYALYDRAARSLTLANSGLPHPYLVRGGRAEPVEVEGVPLGLLLGHGYQQVSLDLEPGDAVVLATDGIEECLDRKQEAFGSERLRQALTRLAGGSARDIADGVMAETTQHGNGAEPYDDRTVVALKIVGE